MSRGIVGDRGRDGTKARGYNTRDRVPTILIVCEGAKTEPEYFMAFPLASVRVEVFGEGRNTVSLVEAAVRHAKKKKYQQVWCVFDRDSFTADSFNAALELARRYAFESAWSNECFELWYVLHFGYMDAAQHRSLYEPRLTQKLGHPYVKNSRDMYRELLPFQPDAIRNARRLFESYDPSRPSEDNPCTVVFRLVDELNRHL